MASLGQVRSALATYLATAIPGLRMSAYVPGQVNPPQGIVAPNPGTMVTFETMGPPAVEYNLRVTVFVSSADDPDSQTALDTYLSHTGANSINQAILNDPTLGGQVDYAVVTGVQGYGLLDWGTLQYLGCHVLITVGTE